MTREDRLDAQMKVLVADARPGEVVPYQIVNSGTVQLMCGLPYRLERQTGDSWEQVNAGMAFRLMGFGVAPGQHRELHARIPDDAPAGQYRLTTSVPSDHVSGRMEVSTRFLVKAES